MTVASNTGIVKNPSFSVEAMEEAHSLIGIGLYLSLVACGAGMTQKQAESRQ